MESTDNYLHSLFTLDGLTAVVIGGTGTLGGAFCEALAGAGAHVLVVGRDRSKGEACVERIAARFSADDAAPGPTGTARKMVGRCPPTSRQRPAAEFVTADATSRGDLDDIVGYLALNNRRCDILVNGAGINSATPFLEISDEEWESILNVNLRSVRLACQVFGRHMIETGGGGSIINVASLSGITPLSRVYTYSASKAAVINLTRNLAREWAAHGIRVNALSPGFFPAEQNRKVLTPERVADIMRHTPMSRFGEPQELAGAILLLAAPGAGSFLTGANIVVDGGFTAMTI